ncbi:MAG: tetratricopeptide repeat protein [Deltaproteobacteria bacterium]|jgi:tetratricopeptide (TPR) repeat protein|nr:tetratricopeptide repeat protein [Deltaproteobacteria bacterium]MBW2519058.1 tetratricopeptide repeat protein [Deltaproteobacteria bacterium]
MKKETLLVGAVALVAGLIIGLLISQKSNQTVTKSSSGAPVAQAPLVNAQSQINEIKGILANDPSNRQAWVKLGHLYFDNNQPINAIDAYEKALELNPNDPDVLTDQGVMFRRMGTYERAIKNFIKANEIDPDHEISLFNLGIVYRYDLKDFEKAQAAWTKYLEVNPNGAGSERVRQELEFLQTHPAIPQNQ